MPIGLLAKAYKGWGESHLTAIKYFNQNDDVKCYMQTLHDIFSEITSKKSLKCVVNKYLKTEQPVVLLDLIMSVHEEDVLSLLWAFKSAKTCLLALSSGSEWIRFQSFKKWGKTS